MGELAPVLPSALGGGALAAVIFYLLRHVASLYRQLGEAQAASSVSATERAIRAEARITALEVRIAELEQAKLQDAADWAQRQAVLVQIRRSDPEAYAKWKWVEGRIDDILRGEVDVS